MTRPTFTISVPGYVPVTVTLEPAAVIEGPAVPPPSADAPQPIVAALADLERRRALAAARQKRRRDRLASRSPSVTERDKPRDSVTFSVTEEGDKGGDGSEASGVERLANKAETQKTPDPKPSQSAPIAPVTRHARVTLSRSPVTHPDQPMTVTHDDLALIAAAFPEKAKGGKPSPGFLSATVNNLALDDRRGFRTAADAARWLLGRVQAWAASPLCKSQGEMTKGYRRWITERCFDEPDSAWAKPEAGAKSPSVGTGTTAAEAGVKTL